MFFEKYIDDFEDSIDGITLLQEYIKPKTDAIIRAEFVDSQFLSAVQVDTCQSGFSPPEAAKQCSKNFRRTR